jgi:hypothetical protein
LPSLFVAGNVSAELISIYQIEREAAMPRASYPGGSDRELFRSPTFGASKSGTSRTGVILLAAVLVFTAAQLIW